MSAQPPGVPAPAAASLAAIRDRVDTARTSAETSRLARARAAALEDSAAAAWAVQLGILLRALADGDEATAAEALDGMPADEVSALGAAALTLSTLCDRAGAGRRS